MATLATPKEQRDRWFHIGGGVAVLGILVTGVALLFTPRELCAWSIAWGDVPTWVGAVGTVAALLWAVFLYRRSVLDKESAQARLLSPVGGAAPVQVLPGMDVEPECASTQDLIGLLPGGRLGVISEAYMATVHIVSTSDETFAELSVALVLEDGSVVDFPLSSGEVAPHEARKFTYYFPPGIIYGNMRVRLRFVDANGRRWERTNGQPVRALN